MSRTAQQEGFGDAFLAALAGVAGCALSNRRPDDDSVDWTLSCRLATKPKLDVQMKTWVGGDGRGADLRITLDQKNYDDLIPTNVLVPRILVVVTVPRDIVAWTDCTPSELILRHAAYWVSLKGLAPSAAGRVTVYLPRVNLLTADSLQDLMSRISQGLPL